MRTGLDSSPPAASPPMRAGLLRCGLGFTCAWVELGPCAQYLRCRYYCGVATTPNDLYESLEEFIVRLMSLAESDGIDALVEMDLSFSHVRALFCLAHTGDEIPIHMIADRLCLSMAAAGRNVDQLVKLNLVQRRESPEDRRVKLVSLTSAGQKIAGQHFDSKRASILAFTKKIPAEQRDALHKALRDILAGSVLYPSPRGRNAPEENCL